MDPHDIKTPSDKLSHVQNEVTATTALWSSLVDRDMGHQGLAVIKLSLV